MKNLPPELRELIAKRTNAKTVASLRATSKHMIRKPTQKQMAMLRVKNLIKNIHKKQPTATQVRRRGYPMNKMPAVNLQGELVEGNAAALPNALANRLVQKSGINKMTLSTRYTYPQLLAMEAAYTGRSINNINRNLRKTAPRGIRYTVLAGSNYKTIINRIEKYGKKVPRKVREALNRLG